MPGSGFKDSVTDFTACPALATANALYNPYAAVPSMHVGFALMLAISMMRITRRRWGPRRVGRRMRRSSPFVVVVTCQPLGLRRRDRGRSWRLSPLVTAHTLLGARCGPSDVGVVSPKGPLPAPAARARIGWRVHMATRDYQTEYSRNRLIESRLTPNAISLTGFALCVVSAVLILAGAGGSLGGIAFIVGSVCDTLDGRYSRMSGKGSTLRGVPGLHARSPRGR